MTIRTKEALLQRQEQMKLRIEAERRARLATIPPPINSRIPPSPFNRPLCTSCKRRAAREGSTLCSRCSYSKQETSLRDTLPGLKPPTGTVEAGIAAVAMTMNSSQLPSKLLYSKEEIIPDSSLKQYTRQQVCKIIGVAPNTLSRWEKRGKTPAPMKVAHSGQYVYSQELLDHLKAYVTKYEQVIHPMIDPTVKAAKEVQTKTFKPNKKLERAVSSRLSIGGGRSIL